MVRHLSSQYLCRNVYLCFGQTESGVHFGYCRVLWGVCAPGRLTYVINAGRQSSAMGTPADDRVCVIAGGPHLDFIYSS